MYEPVVFSSVFCLLPRFWQSSSLDALQKMNHDILTISKWRLFVMERPSPLTHIISFFGHSNKHNKRRPRIFRMHSRSVDVPVHKRLNVDSGSCFLSGPKRSKRYVRIIHAKTRMSTTTKCPRDFYACCVALAVVSVRSHNSLREWSVQSCTSVKDSQLSFEV